MYRYTTVKKRKDNRTVQILNSISKRKGLKELFLCALDLNNDFTRHQFGQTMSQIRINSSSQRTQYSLISKIVNKNADTLINLELHAKNNPLFPRIMFPKLRRLKIFEILFVR
eukprot:UN27146